MYFQLIARTASRLVLISLFVLALAGCGDDAGDTDPPMDEHDEHAEMEDHEDEHDHEGESSGGFAGRLMVMDAENHELNVFDLQSGEVERTFALLQSEASGFGTLLRTSSDGNYGFAMHRTGHYSPDNSPDHNQISVFDGGLTTEGHGDHVDPRRYTPSRLPYRLGHGSMYESEMGLYRPIHWSSHHGLTAIFYDGSVLRGEDDSIVDSVNGVAVAYDDSEWGGQTLPTPIFKLDVGSHAHGGAVAFHDDLFIVSVGMNEEQGGLRYSTLPRGVATYRADAEDVEDDIVQDFRGRCPRLHGETSSGDYVAFGCNEGPEDNDNPNYMGPEIVDRSGVLVLTYNEATDSFTAAEVAYPDDGSETTSGGVRGGMGPSEGIIMATYGQDYFLKIMAAEITDGTTDGTSLLEVEMGSGGNRGYYFEPVDHNYPLGEGRFVVLTRTGNLHIFDLTMPAGDEHVGSVPEIVGDTRESCPEVGCPSFALAPGFAYVTDPANNKVYEVHLEDAKIEREFDLNAPTSLVVLGWFEYEQEIAFDHE